MGLSFSKLVSTSMLVWHARALSLASDSAEGSGSDMGEKIAALDLEIAEESSSIAVEKEDDEMTVQHLYFGEELVADNQQVGSSSVDFPDDASDDSDATTTAPVTRPLPSGHNVNRAKQTIYDEIESVITRASKYDKKDRNFGEGQFLGDELNQLFLACRSGDSQLVKRLRESSSSTNIDINKVTGQKNTEADKQRHGANILSFEGVTPLLLASSHGHAAVVQQLLFFPNIQINKATNFGQTALEAACRKGQSNAVKLLLEHPEIEINYVASGGWTPLMTACMNDSPECVRLLLAHPAINVNQQNDDGETALIEACMHVQPAVVRVLLDHPAIDVNIKTSRGETALDTASDFFVEIEADYDEETKNEINTENGKNEQIVQMLKEHLAK